MPIHGATAKMTVLVEFAALWPSAWQKVGISKIIGVQRTPSRRQLQSEKKPARRAGTRSRRNRATIE
jgi:hypothetical protein